MFTSENFCWTAYCFTFAFYILHQGPPVSAGVYAAADWWLSIVRPASLWLFSEFGAIYKYSDLLTYLLYITFTFTVHSVPVYSRPTGILIRVFGPNFCYVNAGGFRREATKDAFVGPSCQRGKPQRTTTDRKGPKRTTAVHNLDPNP